MSEKTTSTLLGPDGAPIEKPATFLSNEDAELLRAYQSFGEREHLQGEMHCGLCKKRMEVYVQGDIGMFCECRVIYWRPN